MNYEEKYKAALERAKEMHAVDFVDTPHREIAEYIFPELAESEDEDEKIRKQILAFVIDMDGRESWIRWLEKHGQQKPVETALAKIGDDGMLDKTWQPKEQANWKPSDAQMSALRHCCDGWQDNADGRLESLYNDLKKLKEEQL